MLYPTIKDLTNDEFNRYELALATAKCARIITDEYVSQREAANKIIAGSKDNDKSALNMINKDYRDEKAVKNAIGRIYNGEYKMVHVAAPVEEAVVEETVEAVAEEAVEE